MIRIIKYIFLLLVLAGCLGEAEAQWKSYDISQQRSFRLQLRSNFTLEQGNGIASFLAASGQKLVNIIGFETQMQAGYTYLWNRKMGFHTGLGVRYAGGGFGAYNVEGQAMGYMTAYNNEHSATRRTHYTATLSSVRETYDAFFFEIPLQLAFQKQHWWMNAGLKVLVPLYVFGSYDYGPTSLGAGYDIDGFGVDVEVPVEVDRVDGLQGDYTVCDIKGDGIAYPIYVAFALSSGYRMALDEKHMLQFGVYFDIALNRNVMGGTYYWLEIDDGVSQQQMVMQNNLEQSLRYCDFGISVTYNITFGKRIGYKKGNPFLVEGQKYPKMNNYGGLKDQQRYLKCPKEVSTKKSKSAGKK